MRFAFETPAAAVLFRALRSTGEWVLRRREAGGRPRLEMILNDCILLDVDNGLESLSAVGNEALYTEAGLRACRRALRPGGSLAVWSSEPAPRCRARLLAVFGDVEERLVPVARDGRVLEYRILSSRR